MILKNEEGKLNFLIHIFFTFDEMMGGGIIVLHKLAFKLAEKGHNVYIFCKPEYPHPNIVTIPAKTHFDNSGFIFFYEWEQFTFPLDKTISIYPQITPENPFNTKHVSRWILYDTQKEIENTWNENDVYFNFSNFKTYKLTPYRKLTTLDYKLDSLYITNFGNRKSFCHIIHKNTPPDGEKIFSELRSKNLTNWMVNGSFDYLREQFNQYEYFLTYDQKTYLSVMATLCGCKTIILNPGKPYEFTPNANTDFFEIDKITPTEFRINNYLFQFGISYGWEDLKWSEKTLPFVRDYIQELESLDDKTIDNFINYWSNKIL